MASKRRARFAWTDNIDPILPSPSVRRLTTAQRSAGQLTAVSASAAEAQTRPVSASSSTATVKTEQSNSPSLSSIASVSSSSSLPSLSSSSAPAETKLLEQCQCGYCRVPVDFDDETDACCCYDLVPPNVRDEDGRVCRSAQYTNLIAVGPRDADYEH